MEWEKIHRLHPIGEVLEELYPELVEGKKNQMANRWKDI